MHNVYNNDQMEQAATILHMICVPDECFLTMAAIVLF